MPAELFSNNAVSAINGAITNVATSIVVQTGHGARFPAISGTDFFYATLFSVSGTLEVNHEVVKVTARATDTLTAVRGQQGTTGLAWIDGSAIQLRVTKGTMEGLVQTLGATMTGALVVGDRKIHPTQSVAFTPAGATTWYRIGTLQTLANQKSVDLIIYANVTGLGHHSIRVNLSKQTIASGVGVVAKVSLLGIYNIAAGIEEVRFVDAGVNDVTHIDVRFKTTGALTLYAHAESSSILDGHFAFNGTFASQGTGAAGTAMNAQNLETHWDNTNGFTFVRDYSGNVGIGVTPSAWGASQDALQIGPNGALRGDTGSAGLAMNIYFDGTDWRYLNTAAAANYWQSAGAHTWHAVISGTAGNVATLVQTANLSAAGDFTPAGSLSIPGFSTLGTGAPSVKMKKLTGTTAATEGSTVTVAHGLTASKILSVDVIVDDGAGTYIKQNVTEFIGREFNVYFNATNVFVRNHGTNSENLLSKAFSVLVTYEA